MVLLTMTASIVDGLRKLEAADERHDDRGADKDGPSTHDSEPSLKDPAVGNPISHGQIVDLWKALQKQHPSSSLEKLLQGARVYIPPPPPKPEPVCLVSYRPNLYSRR